MVAEVVTKNTVLERCEGEFLELLDLIPSADVYKKKEARFVLRVRVPVTHRGTRRRTRACGLLR